MLTDLHACIFIYYLLLFASFENLHLEWSSFGRSFGVEVESGDRYVYIQHYMCMYMYFYYIYVSVRLRRISICISASRSWNLGMYVSGLGLIVGSTYSNSIVSEPNPNAPSIRPWGLDPFDLMGIGSSGRKLFNLSRAWKEKGEGSMMAWVGRKPKAWQSKNEGRRPC